MDALDRLYRRIADVLLREPEHAVTVGEIYQHLVPYRAVRAELAFSELAEYEHALLRLLSGERDYLVVERADVQEEFQRELRTSNPILGIYRDYAEVGVYLNPYAPEVPALDHAAPPAPAAAESTPAAPSPDGDATVAEPAPQPKARPRLRSCPTCRSALPPEREARFCPFCGRALLPIPCPECSAMVEPDWRFCASCGWPRETGVPAPPPSPEHRLR
jgi:double zinc ribbon protein